MSLGLVLSGHFVHQWLFEPVETKHLDEEKTYFQKIPRHKQLKYAHQSRSHILHCFHQGAYSWYQKILIHIGKTEANVPQAIVYRRARHQGQECLNKKKGGERIYIYILMRERGRKRERKKGKRERKKERKKERERINERKKERKRGERKKR